MTLQSLKATAINPHWSTHITPCYWMTGWVYSTDIRACLVWCGEDFPGQKCFVCFCFFFSWGKFPNIKCTETPPTHNSAGFAGQANFMCLWDVAVNLMCWLHSSGPTSKTCSPPSLISVQIEAHLSLSREDSNTDHIRLVSALLDRWYIHICLVSSGFTEMLLRPISK